MTNLYDSPYENQKYPKVARLHPSFIKTASKRAQCLGSLLMSVAKAGGAVEFFHPNKLKERSVMELIEVSIGQNDIRFCFARPEEEEDNVSD